ncbi:MAG: T9SS type A sorting domain-containing protein [Fluviicola sp.]|nr:T9SS type A sorting domain-containing protein [Fluviicola sp.]
MKAYKHLFLIITLLSILLFFTRQSRAAPPNWVPTPSLQYNMQVVGILQYSGGSTSTNSNDIIGAFVGSECRGIASPFSNGFIFLTIGSNLISGEQISFKAYLASQDMVVDIVQSFAFLNQQQIGDPGNPFVFSYTLQTPTLVVNPSNLAFGPIPAGMCSTKNYQLTGTNLTQNVTITAPVAYQVSLQENAGFATSINVSQSAGAINKTIYVKFCPVAAQSYSGNVSNASSGASSVNVAVNGTGTSGCTPPAWVPLANLQYNMQVIGQIQFSGVISSNVNDIVGAFVGDQCRGIASPMGESGLLFLTVGSNTSSGEQVTFKLWNSIACSECTVPTAIQFENQLLLGDPGTPYVLSCEAESPELIVNPTTLAFGNITIGNCTTLNYLLTGSNLTSNVIVTALPGFQVSLQENAGFATSINVTQSAGAVNQTIYVKFCPVAAQSYSGNVSNASSGASSVNVSVNGTGQYPALPIIFNVLGGGSYCAGTTPTGVTVSLSGSQLGIVYQIKKNGASLGSALPGTGSSLSWPNQSAGTYTIEANNGYQSNMMNGAVLVNETPLSPVSVSIQSSANNVCYGTQVNFTATPTNGGNYPVYQWKVNGNNQGPNSPNFAYTPLNNNVITVQLTSSESCTSGNPAISNAILMVVYDLPIVTWEAFEPDTLCIFWEPVQLSGGLPFGGIYSGSGTHNGNFDPVTAGYGVHSLTYNYTDQYNCSGQATYDIFVDLCTSVSQLDAQTGKATIYPNPTKENFTINYGNPSAIAKSMRMSDVLGNLIFDQKEAIPDNYSFNVRHLKAGIYLLQLKFETETVYLKFVVCK